MPDGSNTAGLILDDREDGIFRVHLNCRKSVAELPPGVRLARGRTPEPGLAAQRNRRFVGQDAR